MGKNNVYKHPEKYNQDGEYDYSDIHEKEEKIIKAMKKMADSFECYKDYIETYAIYSGITEKEWKQNVKVVKKLIKKLRKGDPSVFDIEALNEALDSDHGLIMGIYS